jgi:hypothetical protein
VVVERANNDDILIRVSGSLGQSELARLKDFARYLELISKSKATQQDADKLASEVKETWWKENRNRFIH